MKLKKMRPEAIWLMLAATVLVLALAALAAFVVSKHRWAQSTLAQVEPRHAVEGRGKARRARCGGQQDIISVIFTVPLHGAALYHSCPNSR